MVPFHLPSLPICLGIVAVGFASGVLSGLFGVGGASVSTPGIRLLGVPPLMAVGSTIPPIFPATISGSVRFHRAGLIDWRLALITGGSGSALAILGAFTSTKVDPHLLMVLTALVILASGVKMARSSRTAAPQDEIAATVAAPDARIGTTPPGVSTPALVGVGALAGFLAGLLGIGGGVLMLPAFTTFLHVPLKRAVASSLVAVAVFSVPAMIAHGLFGHIDWAIALLLTIGVVPGAQAGSKITIGTSERTLRVLAGIFLSATAVVYGVVEGYAMLH